MTPYSKQEFTALLLSCVEVIKDRRRLGIGGPEQNDVLIDEYMNIYRSKVHTTLAAAILKIADALRLGTT